MKTRIRSLHAFAVLVPILNLSLSSAFAQGSLTPPPGAPGPTMLTLSQIEPRTPISSVPYTISSPGSYYVTTNLTVPTSESGIFISANNVTLDLNGFTLTGINQLFDAIQADSAQTNIVIRNGSINNWANGVVINSGSNLSVEHIAVSSVGGYGILLGGSGAVRDCMVQGNGTVEFDGIFISGGVVVDCVVSGNVGNGIEAQSSQVRHCLVENNGGIGIVLDGNCQVTGNTLVGNGGTHNLEINGTNNCVEDNHVTGSGSGIGIYVSTSSTNNIIARNTVEGFGANNYSIGSGNDAGPIGSAATATSPWANISH